MEKHTAKRQVEIFELLKGLKWSEVKTLVRSFHPIDELQTTFNLMSSMTNVDRDFLFKKKFPEIVEAYIHEEISFSDLKTTARYYSDQFFGRGEEDGIDNDRVFFGEKSTHEIVVVKD